MPDRDRAGMQVAIVDQPAFPVRRQDRVGGGGLACPHDCADLTDRELVAMAVREHMKL